MCAPPEAERGKIFGSTGRGVKEDRVRLSEYGTLDRDDPRLVDVPTVKGKKTQKLHWAAARALRNLRAAAERAGYDLRVTSGWRPRRWSSRDAYNRALLQRYGSVQAGRKWLAYESPHETGLAFDLGTHGLAPVSATAGRQKATPVYQWLSENAARFGITPYLAEPWHWEVRIPRRTWDQTGPTNGTALLVIVALIAAAGVWWGVKNGTVV
jgi:D-alanyl-D-alanine dipeptidase